MSAKKTSLLGKAQALPKTSLLGERGWWTELKPADRKEVEDLFDAFLRKELQDQLPSKRHLQRYLNAEGIDVTEIQVACFLRKREQLGITKRQSDHTTKRKA
jgi:hypothetical protein